MLPIARFFTHCTAACVRRCVIRSVVAGLLISHAAFAQNTVPAPPSRDGGWDGLARLLEAIKPRVDTTIAPTPSQITDQIEALLDRGQTAAALALIQQRQATERERRTDRRPGVDVQLAFLHARALVATGDTAGAQQQYEALTRTYPELPEPWNNLAALYVQLGQLERARLALQTALTIAPRYGIAQANLADVHLMMAHRAYSAAADLGVVGATQRVQALRDLLELSE